MTDQEFDFSIDSDGQIEYIDPQTANNQILLQSLIKNNHIPINERTEGSITTNMGVTTIDYRTCTQLGLDWVEDVWEEEKKTVRV